MMKYTDAAVIQAAQCNRLQTAIPFVLAFSLVISGCATAPSKDYTALYNGGNYQAAAESVVASSKLNTEEAKDGKLLAYLYTGSAYLAGQSWEDAINYFDHAESVMKDQDMAIMNRTLGSVGAGLVNDNVMSYRRREYDGIMVNGYKALCFMALDKPDLARVELLRADERQRRAVDRFSRLISENQKAVEKEKRENADSQVDHVLGNASNKNQIDAMLANLDTWGAYTDFVNPFVTYLHGLFFLIMNEGQSDLERSVQSLRRVYGMTGSKTAGSDLAIAEAIASGRTSSDELQQYVWVIFENGIGPRKKEKRFDLIVPYKNVTYVGVAIPELVKGKSAWPRLDIRESSELLGRTEQVCNMDAVIASEFKQELPMIYIRAATSTLIKTYIQYAASREVEKKNGQLAGLLTSIALGAIQAATTKADIRIWESLPRDFQIARCPRPISGRLQIHVPGGIQPLAEVNVPEGRGSIIWVKGPAAAGVPSVTVLCPDKPNLVTYPTREYAITN